MIAGITICIFLGTILSKMTVLLASGNILRSNNTLYCIQYQFTYLISNGTENVTEFYAKCITLPHNYNVTENSDSCLNPDSVTDEIYQTGQEYSVCDAVSIRWIWSLVLILITPEFFVLCRNMWTACFKSEDTPSWSLFFKVCWSNCLEISMIDPLIYEKVHNLKKSVTVFGRWITVEYFMQKYSLWCPMLWMSVMIVSLRL